jgi:hypothetical protein
MTFPQSLSFTRHRVVARISETIDAPTQNVIAALKS